MSSPCVLSSPPLPPSQDFDQPGWHSFQVQLYVGCEVDLGERDVETCPRRGQRRERRERGWLADREYRLALRRTSSFILKAMRKMQEDSTSNDGRHTQHGDDWTFELPLHGYRTESRNAIGGDRDAEDHGDPVPCLEVLQCLDDMGSPPLARHDAHLVVAKAFDRNDLVFISEELGFGR
ncbi:hypothetical protein HG531_010853 [Fusarium graminearum]|nr:hypothetical protein HG531_010853 [Fusarium graminearum]